MLGSVGWQQIIAGLLKGSEDLEEISNFPWSRQVLHPEKTKDLMLQRTLDPTGLTVLSALLPRAGVSLIKLDIGSSDHRTH